jgi:branched-chain amino acid transport system ATP-binding protein
LENVLLGSDDHAARGLVGSWLLRPRMWRHERPRWRTAGDLLGDLGVRGALLTEGGDLSYGEQRLVDVGRAVAGRPAVLMLDEPSAGLNDAETIELARLLRSFQASGIALIVVDHKLGLIADICDRIMVIQLGKVIAVGTPEEVWRDPAVADAYLGTVGHA